MNKHPLSSAPSRRTVLAGLGGGAAVLASGGLLTGCSGKSDTGGRVVSDSELGKVIPSHVPVNAVQPDLPAGQNVDPAYLKYPSKLVTSVPDKPGAGSEFTVMVGAFEPPPPPFGKNSYQDAMNRRLGATMKFSYVPAADFEAKLATTMAGNSLPDLMHMFAWALPHQLNAAAPKLFTDLTDYLAGDKVKAYPNLANLGTENWKACVFGGRLYALPLASSVYEQAYYYRKDILDAEGLTEPRNAEEFVALCKALTDAKRNRWATGDPAQLARWMFRAPSDWRKEPDGKLTYTYETDEYAAAIEFAQQIHAAGYVHPSAVAGEEDKRKELFASGRMAMYSDGMGAWQPAWNDNALVNPEFRMQAMAPFAHDGAKAAHAANGLNVFYTFVRKGLPKERVEEALRIANYLAAPLGTTEYHAVNFGEAGVHHSVAADGTPKLTSLGEREQAFAYTGIVSPPISVYSPKHPDFVRAYHSWQQTAAKSAVHSPVRGIHLDVPPRLATIGPRFEDGITDILRGRKKLTELKSLVTQWRSGGGDQLRELYQKAVSER